MLRRFAVVFAASATLTLLVAWPVVERPTERIYGTEISGRHPDPFAAMRRLDFSIADRFTQPGTDWTGAAIAQFAGPVAAYNLIVLLSFPLAAASTDLLVFLLTGSSLGSAWAGLMVMVAPYHLAHAAYHPHVAQIGWQALALAAIVVFVDRPSALRAGAVAISMAWAWLSSSNPKRRTSCDAEAGWARSGGLARTAVGGRPTRTIDRC